MTQNHTHWNLDFHFPLGTLFQEPTTVLVLRVLYKYYV